MWAMIGLALVLSFGGCQAIPPPPWEIGNPRVVGMRVTVVEEGRHSIGLLPIPADRQRAEPLPEDTVDVELLVVDGAGPVPAEDLEVLWFACPFQTQCPFVEADWEALPPCTESFDPEEPCLLASSVRPRFDMPPLDPGFTLVEQFQRTLVALVGVHRPATSCLGLLNQRGRTHDDDCILAVAPFSSGPVAPLLAAAQNDGVPLGFDLSAVDIDLTPLAQPNFHPEIGRVELRNEVTGLAIVADLGGTTVVPPDTELKLGNVDDPRDLQAHGVIATGLSGEFLGTGSRIEGLTTDVFTIDAGRIRGARRLVTGEVGESYSLLVVVSDDRQGHSWAWLDFETVDWDAR